MIFQNIGEGGFGIHEGIKRRLAFSLRVGQEIVERLLSLSKRDPGLGHALIVGSQRCIIQCDQGLALNDRLALGYENILDD